MSAVKARLKLFESNQGSDDMANVARGVRPPLANKPPVSAKFPKANEPANSADTQPNRPANKWGQAVVPNINLEALAAAKNSLNKGYVPPAAEVNHSHDNTSGPVDFKKALKPVDNRRVSVPKVSQANEASDTPKPTEPVGKAAIKPPTGVKTALVPNKLPVPANPSSALNKEDKLPDRAEPINKPWTKTALTPSATTTAASTTPQSSNWGSKTGLTIPATANSQTSSPNANVGAASVARTWGNKVAQTPSATSQSTSQVPTSPTPAKSWNVKVSSPSVTTSSPAATPVPVPETTPSTTSGTTPGSSSQSSQETVDENGRGKFDFRSQMKPRNSITSLGQLTKTADHHRSPMTDITPKNTEPIKSPVVSAGSHSEPEVILRSSPGMKPASVQDKKRQSSNVIIERKSDQKKFKKIKLTTLPPESAVPAKPTLPSGIDLTQIKVEFQKKIQDLKAESDEVNAAVNDEDDDDEIYDEGCSAPSPVLPRKPTFKRNSERVSMIPDMPPEEEGEIYDDGISQPIASDDIYADGETEKKEDSDFEDVYEDEESFSKPVETEEDKKKRLKEEAEAKKREEKERKEKEKLEKELKKKEDKEKKEKAKLIKKLNMTGNETSAGEGTIKQDSKGSGLNLTVKKGQTVTILRLENNPANKWLIKTDENTFGYVDSKNIEVDPSIIRKAMGNARKNSRAPDEDDQPTYDEPPDGTAGDDIEEEIYEEL